MDEPVTDSVVAELQIRNLIARIAHLADQGDLDEYVDQFTEDSVWDYPTAPRRGRTDIRAGAEERRAEGVTGPGTATRHVVTTVAVEVEGPEQARADSYYVFLGQTTNAPVILAAGSYHDSFVRTDRVWRLARRVIIIG